MKKSLEKQILQLDDYLIGIWKFRERGKRPVWCATFSFEGYYYDTTGKATPQGALEAVKREVEKLEKKYGKKNKK